MRARPRFSWLCWCLLAVRGTVDLYHSVALRLAGGWRAQLCSSRHATRFTTLGIVVVGYRTLSDETSMHEVPSIWQRNEADEIPNSFCAFGSCHTDNNIERPILIHIMRQSNYPYITTLNVWRHSQQTDRSEPCVDGCSPSTVIRRCLRKQSLNRLGETCKASQIINAVDK